MNGKGFLLDTNAIIQLLKGNKGLLSIISGDKQTPRQKRRGFLF